MREKRAAETPEQREARLQKMREYNASRRGQGNKEEMRNFDKIRKREARAKETPEHVLEIDLTVP